MHFAREGHPYIFGLGLGSLILNLFGFHLNLFGFQMLGLLLLLLTLFVAFFFRDPERAAPRGERFILSPAYGRVIALEKNFHEERFLAAPATRVGIFLSPPAVHVNRGPVSC